MKKLIPFIAMLAFLGTVSVSSIGCGDDKAEKKAEPKREIPSEKGGPPK
jgi:hypothetical protein